MDVIIFSDLLYQTAKETQRRLRTIDPAQTSRNNGDYGSVAAESCVEACKCSENIFTDFYRCSLADCLGSCSKLFLQLRMQLRASPASSEVTFFSHLLLLPHMKTSLRKLVQTEMETGFIVFSDMSIRVAG